MTGTRVIVRTYRNWPVVRMVWDIRNGRVLITDKPSLARLQEGLSGPIPIGFSPDDVFRYDPLLFAKMERDRVAGRTVKWNRLKRYLRENA